MPWVPFARFLPPAWHRAALRIGDRLRHGWWRLRRPQLRGCALVARDPSGAILMVRHTYRARDDWQLVTGGVERGETHEEAAVRELAEEVGLSAGAMREVLRLPVAMHGATNDVAVFEVQVRGQPRPDRREIAEARFFDPDALPAMPDWSRRYIAAALAG